MQRDWQKILATLAFGALSAVASAQHPPITVLETSVETNGAAVHFPATLQGKIEVQPCGHCASQSLQLGPNVRFSINGREVTLAQIANAALGGVGDPLTIHSRIKDGLVTRVDLTVPQP